MALIQVSQISFESEVHGVKWRHVYDRIINKISLQICSSYLAKLITHDEMKLV